MFSPRIRRSRLTGSGLCTSVWLGLARSSRPSITCPQIAAPHSAMTTLPLCLGVFQVPRIAAAVVSATLAVPRTEASSIAPSIVSSRRIGESHFRFGVLGEREVVDLPGMKPRQVIGEIRWCDPAKHAGLHKKVMQHLHPCSKRVDAIGAEEERHAADKHVEELDRRDEHVNRAQEPASD